ncbi:MAG TPA: DciA family protein [Acidobacteriota bacterium]|nr:DciA family protein [Acidobacteriota bacterium]
MESLTRILYSLHRGKPRHGAWVVACLEGAWSHIVGEGLARVCRPVTFKHSELLIEVLDPAWENPLRNVSADIEAKLRSATGGEVSRIKLKCHQ